MPSTGLCRAWFWGWSFYADPSPDAWANALVEWAQTALQIRLDGPDLATQIIQLLRAVPLVLVLDGLEVVQEGPSTTGRRFGHLLDGLLRQVLTAAARLPHPGLVVLTSRFPFADLAGFDGGSARMLDLPPFTLAEGANLLSAAGVSGLSQEQLQQLAQVVDGHALALTALGALLTTLPEHTQIPATAADLLEHLTQTGPAGRRVTRLLEYYAQRLDQPQQLLVAAVGLFTRPITATQLLTLTRHDTFLPLADWNEAMVHAAIRGPLTGLLTWHPDQTITAHPLVRQVFRPLALGAAQVAVDTALADTPAGAVTDIDQAVRLVESIELLLDADQWTAANDLYITRTKKGDVWRSLPAVQLGQRAATAFVSTPARQNACTAHLKSPRMDYYLSAAGLYAVWSGDLAVATEYLPATIRRSQAAGDHINLSIKLETWSMCLRYLGRYREAADAGAEALTHATLSNVRGRIKNSHAFLPICSYLNQAAALRAAGGGRGGGSQSA